MPVIVDGHLDVAMNALLYERDQTQPLASLRQREATGVADDRGEAMVTLPELRQAGVVLMVATVIARCKPWVDPSRRIERGDLDYPEPTITSAAAAGQLAYYRELARAGHLRLIESAAALDEHMRKALSPSAAASPVDAVAAPTEKTEAGNEGPIGCLLMMEGADPILEPSDVHRWHAAGLCCLSLAHFGHGRYAAGTPSADPNSFEKDAPLSDLGRALLDEMNTLSIALDLTHLSDTSFYEAIERFEGPVCATHANCRALANTPRQLTDRQLKLIIERGGVIGMAGHASMIRAEAQGQPARPDSVKLRHLADHIDHLCQLAGSSEHVAIGSDLDGGFGREKTPADLQHYRDLHQLETLLTERGFGAQDLGNLFYENWWRFYRNVLAGPE